MKKYLIMKNSMKIALGIIAGGVLVFLNQKKRENKQKSEIYCS